MTVLGRHADAGVHTRAAIALDPGRNNTHKNLNLARERQGRFGEAVRCLLEADYRCLPDTRARSHLAELLAKHPEIQESDPALATGCRERGTRPGPVGRARPMAVRLSKSRYLSGLQCSKRLHLEIHARELATPVDAGTQAVLDAGTRVEELARERYPGGV